MSGNIPAVNPHPMTSPKTLARIGDNLLREFIRVSQGGQVPPDRLHLAGVPSLDVLENELRRREALELKEAA